ncbi:restriction endonuclease subunit S [Streptococcus thermophilus]|uniref:restriction endonuclease subunit S n=1 Tax=Streptococcus thermophilus TaxID=1308 RepID=UPI001C64838A|nr:restriction endonuclease subunit S [Streptococcus thermophilus]MBW7827271.1 restriction endonuclease subunit S [Streptococcus thermophilus]
MSEFKTYTLEQLCIVGSSKRVHLSDYVQHGVPFYRSKEVIEISSGKNISEQLFISSEKYSEIKSKFPVPQENDVLITAVGTIGEILVVKDPNFYFKDGNLIWLRNINFDIIDIDYLYYFFKSDLFQKTIKYNNIGAVQKALTIDFLKTVKITLPSLDNQRKLVSVLKSIDQKIHTNNQINQELEAMAKTLYDYWFVQFDFPDQNGKPYKSSGGKMVYHPELKREIPEGWGVARLDQLQIATGKRDANFGTENGKYDFWTTANSPIKADEFSFEGKAILIAGNGNFYVNFTDGKFEAYQRTYVIQSEDEKMLIFMYMACLQSAEKLRKASNGSIIKYITIGDVNNISSPYDHNVVDEFVKIYRPLIDQISKNKKQNQELTQLRDWLLPMLMNGQVKVE